jgi:hypothetical protein
MDQDGVYELVLTGGYVTQIMHYEGGQVYSYQFSYNEIGAIAKDECKMELFFWQTDSLRS